MKNQSTNAKFSLLIILLSLIMTLACSCSEGSSEKNDSGAFSSLAGPLKVHPSNPRYFTDDTGKVIFLSGFEFWDSLRLDGIKDPEGLSWNEFLDAAEKYGINFVRLWIWNELTKFRAKSFDPWYTSREIWMRTGPETALDGKPKFDLDKFNQEYFDKLRSRVIQAGERGFYVSIMLFEGWSLRYMEAPWQWDGHPFNINNNIQGVNGDPDGNNIGTEIHTLEVSEVTHYQEQYVRKIIDTVNDLDNVLYEISNEDHEYSTDWQYYMIRHIKNYEKYHKPLQHPVWMSVYFKRSDQGISFNEVLFNSPADCISPNPVGGYKDEPPVSEGKKVIISDSDHLCGCTLDRSWVWKSFTRGLNIVNFTKTLSELAEMDATHIAAFKSMGHVLQYAKKLNLASMQPRPDLSSTRYCLADPGSEYLIYKPEAGTDFTVILLEGKYQYEWFNPGSGTVVIAGSFTTEAGEISFSAPFSGDAILNIFKQHMKGLN